MSVQNDRVLVHPAHEELHRHPLAVELALLVEEEQRDQSRRIGCDEDPAVGGRDVGHEEVRTSFQLEEEAPFPLFDPDLRDCRVPGDGRSLCFEVEAVRTPSLLLELPVPAVGGLEVVRLRRTRRERGTPDDHDGDEQRKGSLGNVHVRILFRINPGFFGDRLQSSRVPL